MSKKIVMGYWDCPYCATQKILGTHRDCPGCGRPRGNGVRFYMEQDNIEYLKQDAAASKGKGPDWLCSYCNSLNSALSESCTSCGASKSESEKNYYTMHDTTHSIHKTQTEQGVNSNVQDFSNEEYCANTPNKYESSAQELELLSLSNTSVSRPVGNKLNLKHFVFSLFGVIALLFFIIALFPKTTEFTPTDFSWSYEIEIESYETVEESGWSLPSEARLLYTEEELHHYDHVIDHYETKTRTYTEQVPDGYDISYTYSDNGDGTFTEHEVKTPKYRTEYREEEYEEPVYKDVPVYETKYYYEIDKWVYKRSVTTTGTDKEPYWGEAILGENEREGTHNETYRITGMVEDKTITYTCSKTIWEQMSVSHTYKIKVLLNDIIEFE